MSKRANEICVRFAAPRAQQEIGTGDEKNQHGNRQEQGKIALILRFHLSDAAAARSSAKICCFRARAYRPRYDRFVLEQTIGAKFDIYLGFQAHWIHTGADGPAHTTNARRCGRADSHLIESSFDVRRLRPQSAYQRSEDRSASGAEEAWRAIPMT